MFRYCSSVAFLTLLAFSCSSKKNNDDDDGSLATGGAGFAVGTGGATSTGGAPNVGGNTGPSINSERNMRVPTEEDIAQINADTCQGWTAEGEMVPANIEFIVDTSGSMTDITASTGGKQKWEITRTALENSLDSLPRLTSVGMLLWPNMMTDYRIGLDAGMYSTTGDVDTCVNISAMVPMDRMGAVGSSHRERLGTALAAVAPQGGTPMADAYMYAIANNFANNPLMAGSKYAVLITDGQPTIQFGCRGPGAEKYPVEEQPVLDAVSSALQNNQVKTFVIGSPGSEAHSLTGDDGRGWLSQAAQNGGTKAADNCQNTGVPSFCHFDMSAATDFAAGFAAALKHITGQILDCKYTINDASLKGQKVTSDKLNVIYQINGSQELSDWRLVGRANDPSCPDDNGWYLDPDDPNGKTIRLCPLTCEKIQSDAGAVIDIRGGCETVIIIS